MQNSMTTMALAAFGAAALAGTSLYASSQAPAGPETFRLTGVAGAPLPALIEEEEDGCREEVLSGTLALEPDGRWTLLTREREVCGDEVEEEDEHENGRYEIDGDTIRFFDDDDDDEDDVRGRDTTPDGPRDADGRLDLDLDDLHVGVRSASGLSVRLEDGRTELTFGR